MGLFDCFKRKEIFPIRTDELPEETEDGLNKKIPGMIEDIFVHETGTEPFRQNYVTFMQAFYQCPYLYVALSLSKYEKETKDSEPLLSDKDNLPTLYLFSSFETAVIWCEHYQHYQDGGYALGLLTKRECDYQSIYRIAYEMGAQRIMVDEGGRYIHFSLQDMINVNRIPDTACYRAGEKEYRSVGRPAAFCRCRIIERKRI